MKWLRSFGRRATLVAVIALSLTGASKKHQYSPHERAFYTDPRTVQFVRPGLTITINSAQIGADGTISAGVHRAVTDPVGFPLDAAGVTTPGTITLSFVAAVVAQQSGGVYRLHNPRGQFGTVSGYHAINRERTLAV